jgi:hypothetical protein
MVRVQVSQTIDRPPNDVFQFVARDHFKNHRRWDPSIVEMEQTSQGPIGIGATARLVRLDRGRRVEGTTEITAYQPDRRFGAIARFGPFVLHQDLTLDPIDSRRTRLTLVIESRATGFVRILLPVLRGRFARTMRESLDRIKEMVEQSQAIPPDSGPQQSTRGQGPETMERER